jgi:regulator of sigma E protease
MQTILAFIVTIVVIVAIHEFGHYLAMRLFNVRVLTFSIGFGPRLFGWRNRAGTDFVVSAIPFGGYVKPLDRRDCDIKAGDEAVEFSGKPAWQRVITYAAGPLANLLLAFFLYWLVLLNGETSRIPVLGESVPASAVALAGLQSGDELVAIEGQQTPTWQAVINGLIRYAGEPRSIAVSVRDPLGNLRDVRLSLHDWASQPEENPLTVLGITVQAPQAVAGSVVSGGAADKAGLRSGDRVLAVDGEPVDGWLDWVNRIRANPEQPLRLDLVRDGSPLTLTLVPDAVSEGGETFGRAGIGIAGMRQIHYGPLSAVPEAGRRVWQQTTMIVGSIVKLFNGQLSVKTLGGPLTIAQAAGDTAALGLVTFMLFLAFFSVSLGIINLLPVPMLDGGWIVFGVAEMVIRRPLPERFLMGAQSVGLMLVLGLMLFAVMNDISRFLN